MVCRVFLILHTFAVTAFGERVVTQVAIEAIIAKHNNDSSMTSVELANTSDASQNSSGQVNTKPLSSLFTSKTSKTTKIMNSIAGDHSFQLTVKVSYDKKVDVSGRVAIAWEYPGKDKTVAVKLTWEFEGQSEMTGTGLITPNKGLYELPLPHGSLPEKLAQIFLHGTGLREEGNGAEPDCTKVSCSGTRKCCIAFSFFFGMQDRCLLVGERVGDWGYDPDEREPRWRRGISIKL